MHTLYLVSVWLHILAAATWIGGMVFLVAVLVPLLRKPDTRARASELFHLLGLRFRRLGWIALVTLVATGVFNVLYRGYRLEHFVTGDLYQGRWGHILAMKLGIVGVVLALAVVHDFWIGPAATRLIASADAAPEKRERFRRLASVMGRTTFVLALAIVALAVNLVR